MKNSQLAIKISFRSLLKFILPTVIMYVFMALYTLVDGIFVAQFINSDAFAAINIVFPLVSFVIALATMFGSGATAIISKKIGEKNDEFAREVLTFVFIFSILVIIVLCSFMLGFLDPFLRFLGASERLFPYSYEYALYLIPFLPFSILQLQFLFYFTANGKAHLGLIAIVLGGFANLLLD